MADDKLVEATWLVISLLRHCRKPGDPAEWGCPMESAGACGCRNLTKALLQTHTLISRAPSEADIEAMARAYCFAEGCDQPSCKSAAHCIAWDAYATISRAAHSALVVAAP